MKTPLKVLLVAALAAYLPAGASGLTSQSALYTCGYNGAGQLGSADSYNLNSFQLIQDDVVFVSAGDTHTLFLTANGDLYGMGDNSHGELGVYTALNFTRTPVFIASDVIAASAGVRFSLFVKSNGWLYAMGYNGYGQLGVSTGSSETAPLPLFVMTNVKSVSAGNGFAMFIKKDGSLYSMGLNDHGQLGSAVLTDRQNPLPVMPGVPFKSVSCGEKHTLAISTSGTLYGCGWDVCGELGSGSMGGDVYALTALDSGVTQACAGRFDSAYVRGGVLMVAGYNGTGQLGNGTAIDINGFYALDSGVVSVSLGSDHMMYIKNDSSVWSSGSDYYGQLGNGASTSNIYIKTKIISAGARSLDLGTSFSALVSSEDISLFTPRTSRGAKWSDLGWIDDTYLPWVWDYTLGMWVYVYDGALASQDGYWIALTNNFTQWCWGYVYPGYGWWFFDANMNAQWVNSGDKLRR